MTTTLDTRTQPLDADFPPEMEALVYVIPPRERPRMWDDHEVCVFLIRTHRRVALKNALKQLVEIVGKDRTPSKSAACRFWQKLDEVRGASWAKGV